MSLMMLNPMKVHDELWSIGLAASMLSWSPASRSGSEGLERTEVKVKGNSVDPASLYHHFPFPTTFDLMSRGGENCKESMIKQVGGKSFTIDSLLGTAGAQVPTAQGRIRGEGDNNQLINGDNHTHNQQISINGREGRHNHVRKERPHPYHQQHGVTTEKFGDKPQKVSRRSTKSKRVRTIFTPEQLERLEAEFERQQYMVGPERLYLASSLYLTEAQVKVWFQNRRIKWRKQHLEMQQQRLAIFRSKGSHPDNEDDDYEEDSDEDTSKSETLLTCDASPLVNSIPILTSFAGSLVQEPEDPCHNSSNNCLPECSGSRRNCSNSRAPDPFSSLSNGGIMINSDQDESSGASGPSNY